MSSFRNSILQQIEQFEYGRIFTFADLTFPKSNTANVAVVLSELSKKMEIVRAEKGAYYRPKQSMMGLGLLPIYQDEQFRYLTEKLNGYITGAYVYNKMGLTEQVAVTITVATPNPKRQFRFKNLDIECIKSYSDEYKDVSNLSYLRLLDAIKDIKHIHGCTQKEVYERVKVKYFEQFTSIELSRLISLVYSYPPRVRKIVSDILNDINQEELAHQVSKTILPTTRFELNYN